MSVTMVNRMFRWSRIWFLLLMLFYRGVRCVLPDFSEAAVSVMPAAVKLVLLRGDSCDADGGDEVIERACQTEAVFRSRTRPSLLGDHGGENSGAEDRGKPAAVRDVERGGGEENVFRDPKIRRTMSAPGALQFQMRWGRRSEDDRGR